MKPYIIIVYLWIVSSNLLISQCLDCDVKDGELWVIINQNNINVVDKKPVINDLNIISLFDEFNVYSIKQSFPYSKKEFLQKVYKIKFKGETNNFVNKLNLINNGYFEDIIKIPVENKIAVYEPSDYMWQSHSEDWLWHLTDIQADLAWDITRGDTAIKIAILDTWFDINHPDLELKIFPHFDPYDTTSFDTNCQRYNHGTAVASFVAAHTDGGGQLAGIGFNCMIIGYQAWDGNYIERAHDASLRMNADILTSSAGGWTCRSSSDIDSIEQVAVEDIIENGTIIVMPAGNGILGTHCRLTGDTVDSPYFPLHPVYDSSIIIVTSIGNDNRHYYYDSINDFREETHSHYPEVDICAPGYLVMGAICTEWDTCSSGTCCVTNTWPYYGSCIGTSFATPIVAGVCALMKSINPCLAQNEAEFIIKSTADPVIDADQYPGLIGAGRINAYNAVKMAGTRIISNATLSGTQNLSAGYGFNFTNVTIGSTSNISLLARKEVNLNGTFEVPLGSSFSIEMGENVQTNCP
jgi:subtilisin family serine protease